MLSLLPLASVMTMLLLRGLTGIFCSLMMVLPTMGLVYPVSVQRSSSFPLVLVLLLNISALKMGLLVALAVLTESA